MFEMEFKFSKLVKIIVFRFLRANQTVGCSEQGKQAFIKGHLKKWKKWKKEI